MKKFMKRFITILLVLMLVLASTACQKPSSDPVPTESTKPSSEPNNSSGETVKLTIGAASVGGGFHNGASALANAVNSRLDGYELSVEVTGASAANAALLKAGEVPMAMVDTTVAYEAYNGVEDFSGNAANTLRCMFPGWPGTFMFVTKASSNYNNITDLAGSNYSGATTGSGTQIFVSRCLGLFGVKYNELALPNADAARGIGDGTVDGFSLMYPSSTVTELEASHELKILTLTDEQKTEFLARYPQYLWLSIPSGAYKCVTETIHNPGAFNLFCTNSEVEEEIVYQVVKCAYENLDAIEAVFPSCAKSMTPENVSMSSIPYHIGAIRYFNEKGWDIPENLIPAEAK